MAYKSNVPQPTDNRSQSQKDFLGNFDKIFDLLFENHSIFGKAFEGYHKFVTLHQQAAKPATGATEVSLFCKDSDIFPGTPAMFFRNQNNGQAFEFSTYAVDGPNLRGWAQLPSGMLIKWNKKAFPGSSDVDVTVTMNHGPAFTTAAIAFCCNYSTGVDDPQFKANIKSWNTVQVITRINRIFAGNFLAGSVIVVLVGSGTPSP